jgi:hypothetical protein
VNGVLPLFVIGFSMSHCRVTPSDAERSGMAALGASAPAFGDGALTSGHCAFGGTEHRGARQVTASRSAYAACRCDTSNRGSVTAAGSMLRPKSSMS